MDAYFYLRIIIQFKLIKFLLMAIQPGLLDMHALKCLSNQITFQHNIVCYFQTDGKKGSTII
ncbi:hypothetical protein TTHERM_000724801 (macronuclear) [Tetrahymena thermophila SB210]|uniref:Uncharacterized protein n=1 Tax=Tetrahymena thermophila (strain SB210) TaxID=312017 RepID=W7WZX2_TETTS|nr:hypothetical protein TTHERM_000724801 [Tetrahymena thermophila SB210]EWS71157.1 hypothetical protein TTHERM_000724801 [Tetrahymena thermophila SB210]|eukprot:XP_012656298.1 hypothetical protein TTHERM_000724801 [Tetrahymena thermophila SB210]